MWLGCGRFACRPVAVLHADYQTDYLIRSLQLQRHPVLKWGPVGMQLLTETRAKGLTIFGFAGNSAPDHVDHFHGLPIFLKTILYE